MRLRTTTLLARPRSPADRARARLVTVATACAGALVLAGARIATVRDPDTLRLAPYVTEDGLRPGVVLAAALLTVPVLALGWQALRTGSTSRDRRMAALRLAGATPAQVRRVAAVESGRAAILGGLAAGPAYLVLWLGLGAAPPSKVSIVPDPVPTDLLAWLAVVVLAGAVGAASGAAISRHVVAEPLGVRRRASTPVSRRGAVIAAAIGVAAVGGVSFAVVGLRGTAGILGLGAGTIVLVGVAMVLGTQAVARHARRLRRSADPVDVLAAALLTADPRATGRVSGVLWCCGVALGIATVLTVHIADQGHNLGFYLTGTALAAAAAVLAAAVATVTLAVGAAEGLLDARRALASLAALGVEHTTLASVLRRQLTVTAARAAALGAGMGGLLLAPTLAAALPIGIAAVVEMAAVALLAVHLVARVAVRVLAGRLREVTNPEHLRAA